MSSTLNLRSRSVIALVGLLLAVACPAMAQNDYTWNGGNGVFGAPANWTPAGPPGPADRAIFDQPGWGTISFAGSHTNDRLLVSDGGASLDLNSNTYSLTHIMSSDVSVMIGGAGTADLIVADGDVLSAEMAIGRGSSDTGKLTVSGGGTWSTLRPAQFVLGDAGIGSLRVESGSSFTFDAGVAGVQPGGQGDISVSGNNSRFNVTGAGGLTIGQGGSGSMVVTDGGEAQATVSRIAELPGSVGSVSVDGSGPDFHRPPGASWLLTATGQDALTVGQAGRGSLQVRHNGSIQAADTIVVGGTSGATGYMEVREWSSVSSAGSLTLGKSGGFGRVSIADGGAVNVQTDVHVGLSGGGEGDLVVSGVGSFLSVGGTLYVGGGPGGPAGEGEFEVGYDGRVSVGGELRVFGDGDVFLEGGYVDAASGQFDPGAAVTLMDGELDLDGHLDNSGLIAVPSDHGGLWAETLINRAVGRMLVGGFESVMVSGTADNSGRIDLTGGSSRLSCGPMTNTGQIAGDGEVEVGGGLSNNAGGELAVSPGQQLKFSGTVTNDGGQVTLGGGAVWCTRTLTNAGGLIVGNGLLRADGGLTNHSTIALSGQANVVGDVDNAAAGLIRVTGGGPTTFFDDVNNDGEIRVSLGSMAAYFGEVTGSGTFTGGGTNYFEGDLKPGSSAAVLTFEGNVVLTPWATLGIEIGGRTPGEYDQVNVGGQLVIDGTLDVGLIGGYLPMPNTTYSILTCGSRDGQFAAAGGLDDLGGYAGLDFVLTYEAGAVVLAASAVDGDANLDAKVDVFDLAVLANNYNAGGGKTWLEADYTGDGIVDVYDLAALANHYGYDGAAGGQPVPEPATTVLLAVAAGGMLLRRRRCD